MEGRGGGGAADDIQALLGTANSPPMKLNISGELSILLLSW